MRPRRTGQALAFVAALLPAAGGAAPAGEPPVAAPYREYVRVLERPYLRVGLTVTVIDRQGRPVRDLQRDDFTVSEDGAALEVADFAREGDRRDRPLSVAILLDLSYSMTGQVKRVREAAQALLKGLRPGDEIMVAKFNDQLTILQRFTGDTAAPEKTLGNIGIARGGTLLFRSIEQILRELRERPGRKVILIVSDGEDNEIERGSVYRSLFLQDLLRLCFRTQTVVYGIRPGIGATSWLPFEGFVEETGGRLLYTGGDLASLFARLGEEFLSQYYLAYDVDPKLADKRRRSVRVEVDRKDVVVKTVRGFNAAPGHVKACVRDLEDKDPLVRADAVYDLGFVPDPRALPALVGAVADTDERVRRLAATSLGRLGDLRGLGPLLGLLGDPATSVRVAAGEALVLFADRAIPALVEEVSSERVSVPRLAALMDVLGRVGDDRAVDPLSAVLRTGPTGAKTAAAEALGALGLSGGIPSLRAALLEPVPEVRAAAARSIIRIAGADARAVIEDYIVKESDPRLKQAARALLDRSLAP